MSTVYVLEPPTRGKVVLNTTCGPLDIELWPKEAPKAVRNFVQLCLEGYYDSTIFHRIIKDFIVQGGDPTGSGTGGESIYGGVFPDEFHSRLRFKHRGLVACANAGSPHSNGSQFFITLSRCDDLDKKHTIFGKVTGDSIYNLTSLGEFETDKDDRPVDPPKIKSVEVLWNPFDDIVPRAPAKPGIPTTVDSDNKDIKKKAVKKLNLLSFGEEAEEDEKELAAVKKKIKSSHDVLDDPRLLKDVIPSSELDNKRTREMQLSVRETLASKKQESRRDSDAENSNLPQYSDSDDDEANFDARMRQQILRKRTELGDAPSHHKSKNGTSDSKNNEGSTQRSSAENTNREQPKVEKLSMKKKGIGSEARAERMANADSDLQLLGEAERGRQLQKLKKRRLQGREDEVLAKLANFKKAISGKPTTSSAESEGGNDELSDWKSAGLKFTPEPGKDRMTRSDDPNDYVVHDPLLEKGKEKFNKMQAKQKRREREWAGKSLT
ncbi:peptidyl-prolyl cis-trans isomerase CYP57 [Cucurbita moschata]|uniref:Peptidyl-prolyl cis-trans isomerase CYP57 n=1 Tax=Cucurbita moschata TaxID=3662 RepID=A0A6J1FMN2_CUCMO|nr:peptidyl-prolyl cis-trans isomerase CYP57 [Cucurbita moschata]